MKKQTGSTGTVAQAADTAKFLATAGTEVVALGVLTAAGVALAAAEYAVAKIAFSEKATAHAATER